MPGILRPPCRRVARRSLPGVAAVAVAGQALSGPTPVAAQGPAPQVDSATLRALDRGMVGPYRGGRSTAVT